MERFILAVEGAEAVGATPAQELGHRYSFHILAAKGAGGTTSQAGGISLVSGMALPCNGFGG